MRILSIEVRNYRCIAHLKLNLDSFSAFIGANGTGKSAVLHALDWFFNGGKVDEFDFRVAPDGSVEEEFSVSVTLSDLSSPLLSSWGRYVRAGELSLRRTATRTGRDQLSGLHMQGPGFAAVRSETDTAERRSLYKALRADLPELPAEIAKAKIEEALLTWENDAANAARLVEVKDADLTNAFGFYGKQLLGSAIQFVLVPASIRLEDNVDPTGRGGAIDQLLGTVVRAAAEAEVTKWSAANEAIVSQLASNIGSAVTVASKAQMDATNRYLAEVISGGSISIEANAEPPRIRPEIGLTAAFDFQGSSLPIAKQGHGVQRSVMMAALQAAAEISATGDLFSVLAIEEPELYQHPARSTAMSRALNKLVMKGAWQVLIATHSPSFLRPESAAAVRRFSVEGDQVRVVEGSVSQFAKRIGLPEETVSKHLEKLLPSEFSNALFSDRVLLVEGASDRILIGRVLALLGHDVDAKNWSIVNCEGKENLPVASSILATLGIDVRVLFDADCRGDDGDAEHKRKTGALLAAMREVGLLGSAEVYEFGDETIALEKVAILKIDIEAEEELWPSFMTELTKKTGGTTTKNPHLIRVAAEGADLEDCPPSLLAAAGVLAND